MESTAPPTRRMAARNSLGPYTNVGNDTNAFDAATARRCTLSGHTISRNTESLLKRNHVSLKVLSNGMPSGCKRRMVAAIARPSVPTVMSYCIRENATPLRCNISPTIRFAVRVYYSTAAVSSPKRYTKDACCAASESALVSSESTRSVGRTNGWISGEA